MNVIEYFNDRNSAIQFMEEIIDEINEDITCGNRIRYII